MEFNEVLNIFKEDLDIAWLHNELENIFPIDIAYGLEECENDDIILFCKHIEEELLFDVIEEAPTDIQVKIIKLLETKTILDIFCNVPPDDVVDILGELSFRKRKELLKLMKDADTENIEQLLKYQRDSAGGIMTTEYIALRSTFTVKQALDKIKQIALLKKKLRKNKKRKKTRTKKYTNWKRTRRLINTWQRETLLRNEEE